MRIAVVLFNLGGPDSPAAVQPFLFNLFNDPAIISVPTPFRWLLAKLISTRRAPVAREIYGHIGGKSPLLELTDAQASALQARFSDGPDEVRTFVCMRYWHPMSDDVARAVGEYKPDRIVLLPLYPQYSTTTSGSSIKDWHRAARTAGVHAPTVEVCCYPMQSGFVEAQAALIRPRIEAASAQGKPRVLFSAHGLPKKVIASGDPYQWQVERTAAAVVDKLAIPGLDWLVCYQSRVGPLEWIGPSTDDEIKRGGADGVPLVVVPIAFVSEHSETLVELDIEYKHLATENGVTCYERVPAVGTAAAFIDGLAMTVRSALGRDTLGRDAGTAPDSGGRLCPAEFGRCPCRAAA